MSIRKIFEEELADLKTQLVEMCRLTEKMIADAITALVNRDRELGKSIGIADKRVDEYEMEIEKKCNGHKLIQNYDTNPMFYTVAKYYNSSMGAPGLEVCNGEIVLQTQLLYFGATDNAYKNAATDTNYKTFDIDFDKVKFTYTEQATSETFLGIYTDSSLSGGKKVGYNVNFTGCVFDFSNATAMTKVMTAKDDAITKCNSIVNVTVNGCEMITKNPQVILYEEHETNGSSVVFAKGTDDKYLKMTVIGSDEAPTATANNDTLRFKRGEDDAAGNKTYELIAHTHDFSTQNHNNESHWMECACGEKNGVTAHVFDNACDTDCACGYVRSITHNFDIPDHDETHHWNKCECGEIDQKIEHSFDSNCDTDCACGYVRSITHNFNIPDHDETHHWNKCECGEIGEKVEHSYTVYGHNDNVHWLACSVCESVDASSEAEHSYADVQDSICDCGFDRGHVHFYDQTDYDDNGHWNKCECGQIDESSAAEHIFDSNCDADCACGFVRAIVHRHNILNGDETHHWYECECGDESVKEEHYFKSACATKCALCEYERATTDGHTYSDVCDVTCNVCREERIASHVYTNACDDCCNLCFAIRTAAPHSGGSASCEKRSECSVCGVEYGELADHAYTSSYIYSTTHHWYECACGARKDESEHSFGEYTEYGNARIRSCACGYTVTSALISDGSETKVVVIGSVVGCAVMVANIGLGLWIVISKKRLG